METRGYFLQPDALIRALGCPRVTWVGHIEPGAFMSWRVRCADLPRGLERTRGLARDETKLHRKTLPRDIFQVAAPTDYLNLSTLQYGRLEGDNAFASNNYNLEDYVLHLSHRSLLF